MMWVIEYYIHSISSYCHSMRPSINGKPRTINLLVSIIGLGFVTFLLFFKPS
jgi:hypothetical protein